MKFCFYCHFITSKNRIFSFFFTLLNRKKFIKKCNLFQNFMQIVWKKIYTMYKILKEKKYFKIGWIISILSTFKYKHKYNTTCWKIYASLLLKSIFFLCYTAKSLKILKKKKTLLFKNIYIAKCLKNLNKQNTMLLKKTAINIFLDII